MTVHIYICVRANTDNYIYIHPSFIFLLFDFNVIFFICDFFYIFISYCLILFDFNVKFYSCFFNSSF